MGIDIYTFVQNKAQNHMNINAHFVAAVYFTNNLESTQSHVKLPRKSDLKVDRSNVLISVIALVDISIEERHV